MKKLVSILLCLTITGSVLFAQAQKADKKTNPPTEQSKAKDAAKEKKAPATGEKVEAKKAPKVKKDGTPDKRFNENKNHAAVPAGPVKKDGTADKRFKANKDQAAVPAGPVKKDGKPDMRHKVNREANQQAPAKK